MIKRMSLALAALVFVSSTSGCCLCRRLWKPRTVVTPAPVCSPAPTCCPAPSCGDCGCCDDGMSYGAPMGPYSDPGIQYGPAVAPGPIYGNPSPPPGP